MALHAPIKFDVPEGWKLDAYGVENSKAKGPDDKTAWSDVYHFVYEGEYPDEAKCVAELKESDYTYDVQALPSCSSFFMFKAVFLAGTLGRSGLMHQLFAKGFHPVDEMSQSMAFKGVRAYNPETKLLASGTYRQRFLKSHVPPSDYVRSVTIRVEQPWITPTYQK
jgi:hypothetical protein